jgi:hypothetical protein
MHCALQAVDSFAARYRRVGSAPAMLTDAFSGSPGDCLSHAVTKDAPWPDPPGAMTADR